MTEVFLVTALTPLVVLLATYLVTFIKKDIPPAIITGVVVPFFSIATAWVGTLVAPTNMLLATALGLLATFIHELVTNFTNTTPAAGGK